MDVPVVQVRHRCSWYWLYLFHSLQHDVRIGFMLLAQLRREGEEELHALHPIGTLLSYLAKAPLVPDGTPVINALSKQRACLENFMRALVGLPPDNNMLLQYK